MEDSKILTTIFEHQIKTNELISGPDWKKYNWSRPLWLECAEVMDHLPWKNIWWNNQDTSHALFKLELIDVFIFGISLALSDSCPFGEYTIDKLAEILLFKLDFVPKRSIEEYVESIAEKALHGNGFDYRSFKAILMKEEISIQELYRWYLGKNTLVQLRKAYSPSYEKIWDTVSDNLHLAEILESNSQFKIVDYTFVPRLYTLLENTYVNFITES